MKTQLVPLAVALCCGFALAATPTPRATAPAAQAASNASNSASLNWLMDGGDNQRSGWLKGNTGLTPANVKNMKLLWVVDTHNVARAMQGLMAPVVVENVPTADGPKEVVYVVGASDNLYAIDTSNGKILWHRHFTYPAPVSRFDGYGAPAGSQDPAHLGFLRPGGTTDTPAIGPAEANGHRLIYVDDGGGFLHIIDDVTGQETRPAFQIGVSKFSLQLYKDQIIFAPIYTAQTGIVSVNVNEANPKVNLSSNYAGGGGLWGRRGPSIDAEGRVWTTVGDGTVNTSNPDHLTLGNSVIGFTQQADGAWKVTNWFTPDYWRWLQKRDLDWNNTPTIFHYHGQELIAASGKECRLYLLDPNDPGGVNHDKPLYRTARFCNDDADFQNSGSWGALSSWQDSSGTRWVVAPFWGPASTQTKFPITNTPLAKGGGEAAYKVVEVNGSPELQPVWVSRNMHRGDPSIINDGMVFAFAAGDNTQQAWPDIGLQFDSSIRAALSGHATIYVLDGQTGKLLWSSGNQIQSFAHFSGLALGKGKVFIGTHDGLFYCFGLPQQ